MKSGFLFAMTIFVAVTFVSSEAFCFDRYPVGCTGPVPRVFVHQESRMHQCPFFRPTNRFALRGFLGGLFGGEDTAKGGKDGYLAVYDVSLPEGADINVKYESLSDFITNKWAPLFVNGGIKLTTPVRLSKEEGNKDIVGCRLIFEKVDTGYTSKKEEEEARSVPATYSNESDPSEKKESSKQGGVKIEILLPSNDKLTLQVRATRCDIDDDTMIKEMSEEMILKELRKAIDVWEKET